MTKIKAVSVSEIEKLQQYVMIDQTGFVEQSKHGDYVHIDDIRALLERSPSVSGEAVTMLALNNTVLQKRISVLEDLLSSAYNIANRNGENTHWERFAGQLHINGIRPITAKTFKILPSDIELSAYKPQDKARE